MAKPFRFRHAREIVGLFVLTGLGLLIFAVVMVLVSQGWFVRTKHFTVELPESGSMGLKPGADVLILGNVVGSVHDINLTTGEPRAEIVVRADFARFITADSKASVKTKLGIGDASVEISRGKGTPMAEGETIHYAQGKGATDLAEDLLKDVRAEILPTIRNADRALAEYRELAADLRSPESAFQRTLVSMQNVAESVERGDGLAGKLLADPEVAKNGAEIIAGTRKRVDELERTLADIHKATTTLTEESQAMLKRTESIVANVDKTTASLPESVAKVNRTLDTLPGLLLETQEAVRQYRKVAEAMQGSFLLRGAATPDNAAGTIRPENIGSGGR